MDPVTLTQTIVPTLRVAGASADLFVVAATWLYHSITDTQPIKDISNDPNYQDKTRYDRLCNYRKQLTGTDFIPAEWRLNHENKPIKKVVFQEEAAQLKLSLDELRTCNYHQKLITIGLLSNIQSILDYMNNTKPLVWTDYTTYRDDGYEAMFFADLALWIGVILPRYDVKDPVTADLVLKWIKYCELVQSEVLVSRNDAKNAENPKEKLSIIINELNGLHANLCRVNKASSFNDKIQQINSLILDMAKNTFDLFHLMIKNAPHRDLQVAELLREANNKSYISNPKIKAESQSLMGRWIVESLKKLGITSFSWENKNIVDINSVGLHICPDFSGIHAFDKTGLWPFSYKNNNKTQDNTSREKAIIHLKHVADLHRILLKLYSVRESVVLGAMVSKDLGDAWVYGEDTALALIEVLMKVIDDAVNKLNQGVLIFWQQYYHKDFKSFSANPANGMDNKALCFQRLSDANKTVEHIASCYNSIKSKLNDIETAAKAYQYQDKDSISDKISALRRNLGYYVTLEKIDLTLRLKQELIFPNSPDSVEASVQVVTRYFSVDSGLATAQETVFGYDKELLPFYREVEEILYPQTKKKTSQTSESGANNAVNYNVHPKEPDKFHSNFQLRIYWDILRKNSDLFTGWFKKWRYSNPDKFGEMYRKINRVYSCLYLATEKPIPIEIILIDAMIHDYIIKQFAQYQFYNIDLYHEEPFFIFNLDKEHIYVTVNEQYKGVVDSYIKKEHALLIDEVNNKSAKIEELERKNKELLEGNIAKDSALIAKQAELDTTKAELDTTKAELDTTKAALDTTKAALDTTKAALKKKDETIDSMSEAISILNEELRAFKTEEDEEEIQSNHDGSHSNMNMNGSSNYSFFNKQNNEPLNTGSFHKNNTNR